MDIAVITEQIRNNTIDCLILVHPQVEKLEAARSQILKNPDVRGINIGKELSSALLDSPLADRGKRAQHWFLDEIGARKPGPVQCSQIDLLFEPSFGIDPLHLFLQGSRITRLIVLWPGDYSQGTLSYAVPEHAHYRSWHIVEPTPVVHRLAD